MRREAKRWLWIGLTLVACAWLAFAPDPVQSLDLDRERWLAGYSAEGLQSPPPEEDGLVLAGHACAVVERSATALRVTCEVEVGRANSAPLWDIADAFTGRFVASRYLTVQRLRVEPIGVAPWLPWLSPSSAVRLSIAALILTVIWVIRRRRRRDGHDPEAHPDGRDALSPRTAWLCAIALLLVVIGTMALGVEQGAAVASGIVATVLVAPLWEEVLYREALLRFQPDALLRGFAVGIGAFAFAFAHGQPSRTLELVAFGVICGLSWCRTRSVWPPVALHAAWNFVVSTT